MLVDGIPPSLRGSVDFCSFGEVFPQEAKVSGMWEFSLAPHLTFVSVKSP
jgi:hypothetical protein